jgi:NAD(P)-dependent dehydrogenase (short-subunit alcohol dehydrogenase family)
LRESRRPGAIFSLYAMTKTAVDAMTLALTAELDPQGITVNTVAPGWTATDANARQDVEAVRSVEGQTALGHAGRHSALWPFLHRMMSAGSPANASKRVADSICCKRDCFDG